MPVSSSRGTSVQQNRTWTAELWFICLWSPRMCPTLLVIQGVSDAGTPEDYSAFILGTYLRVGCGVLWRFPSLSPDCRITLDNSVLWSALQMVNVRWEECHFRDLRLWLGETENFIFWQQSPKAMGHTSQVSLSQICPWKCKWIHLHLLLSFACIQDCLSLILLLSDDSMIIVGGGQCEQFPVFFQWVEYL